MKDSTEETVSKTKKTFKIPLKPLHLPSLIPTVSPFVPQYHQQRDRNENMQTQIDLAKRAFEDEKIWTQALQKQKEDL